MNDWVVEEQLRLVKSDLHLIIRSSLSSPFEDKISEKRRLSRVIIVFVKLIKTQLETVSKLR